MNLFGRRLGLSRARWRGAACPRHIERSGHARTSPGVIRVVHPDLFNISQADLKRDRAVVKGPRGKRLDDLGRHASRAYSTAPAARGRSMTPRRWQRLLPVAFHVATLKAVRDLPGGSDRK